MEVNSKNFSQALLKIEELLQTVDFVSFDTELTGLGISSSNKYNDLDTEEERYEKARKAVINHGIIQFGISLFRLCKMQKKYFSSSFSFYVVGNRIGSYRYDVSAMTFLANNGFDFNKLFLEGLPFMSIGEEQDIREKREQKLAEEQSLPSPIKNMDKNAKEFVKSSIKKVESAKADNTKVIFPGASLSSFHRKLLYNNVASNFPTAVFKSTRDSERNIEVTHFKSLQEKDAFVSNLWEEDLLEKIGFVRVIRLILEARKPLITHNGCGDVLHFIDKFISPLPEKLEEFRLLLKTNMPDIYDTKLIAKDPPFSAHIPNSSLGNLYQELCDHFRPPKIDVETGCDSYKITDSDGQQHDAGYDAFMTGVCFSTMLKHLDGSNWASNRPMDSKHLVHYCNKLNFMFSYDHVFIDLHKMQAKPDRSHLFTVICPATFTMMDSRKLLKKIKSYKIVWVSDTKFHVVLEDNPSEKEMFSLQKELSSICPPNVFLSRYKQPLSDSGTQGHSGNLARAAKDTLCLPLSLKRSSEANGGSRSPQHNQQEGLEEPSAARSLKRLKSVGSSELSQMTLESPTQEPANHSQGETKMEKDTTFNVPDEW